MIKHAIIALACVGLVGTASAEWDGTVDRDAMTDEIYGYARVSDSYQTALSPAISYICNAGGSESVFVKNMGFVRKSSGDTHDVMIRIDDGDPVSYRFTVSSPVLIYGRHENNSAEFDALVSGLQNARSRIAVRVKKTEVFTAAGSTAHISRARNACNLLN